MFPKGLIAMARPSEFDIRRAALIAAAECRESPDQTVNRAEVFAEWLRKGLAEDEARAAEEACCKASMPVIGENTSPRVFE
jgi:hypothetical protein